MELKSVLPIGALVGICLILVYVGGPINPNFASLAPGLFMIGMIVWGISQTAKYLKSRKLHKQIRSAV